VLSTHEQQLWHDIERWYAAEVEDPPRGVDDLPGPVVTGIWTTVVLLVLGFTVAGLAVGALTALGGLLWRWWPLIGGRAAPGPPDR
jgi:hypothetical protein